MQRVIVTALCAGRVCAWEGFHSLGTRYLREDALANQGEQMNDDDLLRDLEEALQAAECNKGPCRVCETQKGPFISCVKKVSAQNLHAEDLCEQLASTRLQA